MILLKTAFSTFEGSRGRGNNSEVGSEKLKPTAVATAVPRL
jgi:hypothetical protein